MSAGLVEKDQEQHALMPLYHFCMNDLPVTTKALEMDDRNAVAVLKADADKWTGVDDNGTWCDERGCGPIPQLSCREQVCATSRWEGKATSAYQARSAAGTGCRWRGRSR